MSLEVCEPASSLTAEFDLGIDARLAREMRDLILDETIELEITPRSAQENSHEWDKASLVEYGQWLCALLDISPEQGDKPLSVVQINRAARLGIGPSRDRMQRELDHGITELQEAIGFTARDRYKMWPRSRCIEEGKALADRLQGRPGTQQLQAAHARGEFLSVPQVINRFDSIQNFQELIGRPSVRGWSATDHAEWGAAIKRQNGPDTRITSTMIRKLAGEGRGPNYKAISKHYPTLAEFNAKAEEEYWLQIDLEEQDKEFWRDEAKVIIEDHDALAKAVADIEDEDRVLAIVGRFQLASKLMPSVYVERVVAAALHDDQEYISQWIRHVSPNITMAQIENTASVMRIFNILWPMYRFQNVDLKVA